ncbi:MAG: helix-turn-helix transcriptional regulator [Pseudomonadota bacterium]
MSDVASGLDDTPLDKFGDETIRTICRALSAEWGAFYRLGSGQQQVGFRLYGGVPREFGAAYLRRDMQLIDPLHPQRMVSRKHTFLMLGEARAEDPARHGDFVSFLHSFGARDSAEMIFSFQGKAVAGLSLAWRAKKPEQRSTIALGTTLQAYIEFNLGAVWPAAVFSDASAADKYAFTSREKEVIHSVCRGSTNEQIAAHLNIGIATVKTHLIHIFRKAGVETRGELIGRSLSRSAMWARSPHASA